MPFGLSGVRITPPLSLGGGGTRGARFRGGFLIPEAETAPPMTKRMAVAISNRWNPARSSCFPATSPTKAMPIRPATRATALFTA